MTTPNLTPHLRNARNHAGTIIMAAIMAFAVTGAFAYPAWLYLTDREDRLERREARVDALESDLRTREDAARATMLENEKQSLALAQEHASIATARAQLEQLDRTLAAQRKALAAQQKTLGIDAQERALREEARQLVADYTTMLGKPENVATTCAKQLAHETAEPLLDRIIAIGSQLRNGGDLIDFAQRQSFGIRSSHCDNAEQVARAAPTKVNQTD